MCFGLFHHVKPERQDQTIRMSERIVLCQFFACHREHDNRQVIGKLSDSVLGHGISAHSLTQPQVVSYTSIANHSGSERLLLVTILGVLGVWLRVFVLYCSRFLSRPLAICSLHITRDFSELKKKKSVADLGHIGVKLSVRFTISAGKLNIL